MNLLNFILSLTLVSCTTDPRAGAVAARMTNQEKYVAYERNGKTHTAAVFPFAGVYWSYDGIEGSRRTNISSDRRIPLLVGAGGNASNARWEDVGDVPLHPIPNACLPLAIYQQRLYGGTIMARDGHAICARR